MLRKIIKINAEKCSGCGACAAACHEGAIGMVDGKAKLLREDYCDGLGDCLPACPTGAISFEEREAPAYDHAAVMRAKAEKNRPACSCPSAAAKRLQPEPSGERVRVRSQLMQWPCQIKLVPPNAPYFENAHLLIAADCTAFAYGNFHADFMQGCITLIGCPKLDAGDYAEKLTHIIKENNIQSIKVLRMEVPCCGGLENAAWRALTASGKTIPFEVVTVTTNGEILKN